MDRVDYVIVGLGLNVNTPAEGLPEEIAGIATSLFTVTGRTFSRVGDCSGSYLEKLEATMPCFRTRHFEPIRDRWKELSGSSAGR